MASSAALGGAALDDQEVRMLIVEKATLDAASVLLDELLAPRGLDRARTAALLLRAVKATEDEEHGLALIIGWSLSEQMLNSQWTEYLKRQGVSNTRIQKRLRGRDWTATVITEVLSVTGQLDEETYTDLSAVRKARNDWVHKVLSITQDEAHLAVKLTGRLGLP